MKRINVTKSFLPPIEKYEEYLKKIWESGFLTNQGPLLQEFEAKTREHLKVDNFHFVNNGTSALQVALRALDITEGEIITTPFSYVATTSSILWERCDPVFVDIESNTYCIDAEKIEAAITPKTKAIMAVHVFGFPCDVEKIQEIADKHNLKVIYDGAHAFGVEYKGRSLLSYGDISICSFHATKLFHTIEGGCVIAKDQKVSDAVELVKRFGHDGDNHYSLGFNAKANEFQAAMGLCNLEYVDSNIKMRSDVFELYNKYLNNTFKKPPTPDYTKQNYAYYPIQFETQDKLMSTISELQKNNIYPRRYFYPSLNTLPYINNAQVCPVSESIAATILCLPLYPGLEEEDIKRISNIINQNNES